MRRYQGCERTCQLRRLLKLLHKAFKVQGRRLRFYRFFWWTDVAKIRLGIEGCLEFLSVDLSILVQNVSIDTGYHVDLGMARIALGGFQIAVVEFQFVGGTGMTERMKDHLRQPCVLTELCKLFEDDPILAGPSIGKCHHQIEVLILVTQEAFQLVLGLLPFPQNVGQRFRQPHLTDTGVGFRLFKIILVLVFGMSGVKM